MNVKSLLRGAHLNHNRIFISAIVYITATVLEVVYQVTIKTVCGSYMAYIGVTWRLGKERFYKHKSTFEYQRYDNRATPFKYICEGKKQTV